MGEGWVLAALDLDDSYEVIEVLGEGPGGRTELVRMGGSRMVRKCMPSAVANVAAWTALMGIDDELLARVVNVYRLPDELVVICEWVEGTSFGALVEAEGRLEPARAVGLVADVAHAAGVLHDHGVIHRDIVAGNVIVDGGGRAHLIDLGIARVRDDNATSDTTKLGTWGFAAPEQYGFAQTDARSDVFSLGRLLAYLLTGLPPDAEDFDGALHDEALVPPALAGVVARACSFEPSARQQSAAEFAREALAALEAATVPGSEEVATKPEDDAASASVTGASADGAGGGAVGVASQPGGASGRAWLPRALLFLAIGVSCLLIVLGVRAAVLAGGAADGAAGSARDGATNAARNGASDAAQDSKTPLWEPAWGSAVPDEGLVVRDSAYLVESGFVEYVVAIENPNADVMARFAHVTVSGRGKDGATTFSDEWTVGPCVPGSTTYWASQAGDGSVRESDHVEIAVSVDADGWEASSAQPADRLYAFEGVQVRKDQLGYLRATGEVRLVGDAAFEDERPESPMLVCVLRDEDGGLVAGFSGYLERELSVGEQAAFDIGSLFGGVAFASAEMHANPWW